MAAGATLTPKKVVPTGEIWAGNPAKFLRELDEEEASFILQSANNYTALAAVHAAENSKSFYEIEVQALSLTRASLKTESTELLLDSAWFICKDISRSA